MYKYRTFEMRSPMILILPAICMTLLCCSSAGCAKRVSYVNNDHRLTRLQQNQAAPRPGILVSEGYLSELHEALGRTKPNLEGKPATSATQAETIPQNK